MILRYLARALTDGWPSATTALFDDAVTLTPKPETHHVRWIACRPNRPGRKWVAIESGAPFDTQQLAIHPAARDTLRVSAGDGYLESYDGGLTWSSPMEGLDVGYLRSVAVDPGDPDTVVVFAATHAHAAYMAGRSGGTWQRVSDWYSDTAAARESDPRQPERIAAASQERRAGVNRPIDRCRSPPAANTLRRCYAMPVGGARLLERHATTRRAR